MAEIKLRRRLKYAGDVHQKLLEAGWPVEMATEFVENIPDAESDEKGCEYCAGDFAEYQYTCNTRLYINTFGKARTLETECNPCPPYSKCCMRGIPARSAFIINYCPNCGRKLGVEANG